MEEDTVLQRFQQFKEIFVSSNMPNAILLELIESYINPIREDAAVPDEIPVLDGQMSLFEIAA